jgi:lipid II:glycine glycyltransferase (peptidoglycan interpeptide bridge formation enzyme)
MSFKIEILNPTTLPDWDTQVQSFPECTFFHSAAWAKVLSEAYGFTPLYFCAKANERLKAVMPVMEVNSFLTGRRGVSLPFSDYCEPLAEDQAIISELFNEILEYGGRKWKYIESRGENGYVGQRHQSCSYFKHILGLSDSAEKLLASFRKGTKSAITKAIRENQLQLRTTQGEDGIKEFYRLNCLTRKRHGIPPQPYHYFKILHDFVIAKGQGFIVLAEFENRIIASGVFLHFGKNAIYKYGASDTNFQQLRPNNLIVWEAIKWYCRNGFKEFDFGRTEPENEGLRIFKSGWNTVESIINYYKYDFNEKSYIVDQPIVNPFVIKVFNHVPIAASKFIGRVLYRHIG